MVVQLFPCLVRVLRRILLHCSAQSRLIHVAFTSSIPLRCKKMDVQLLPLLWWCSKEAIVWGWLAIQVGFRRVHVVFPPLIPLHCKEMVAECLALLWGLCGGGLGGGGSCVAAAEAVAAVPSLPSITAGKC